MERESRRSRIARFPERRSNSVEDPWQPGDVARGGCSDDEDDPAFHGYAHPLFPDVPPPYPVHPAPPLPRRTLGPCISLCDCCRSTSGTTGSSWTPTASRLRPLRCRRSWMYRGPTTCTSPLETRYAKPPTDCTRSPEDTAFGILSRRVLALAYNLYGVGLPPPSCHSVSLSSWGGSTDDWVWI